LSQFAKTIGDQPKYEQADRRDERSRKRLAPGDPLMQEEHRGPGEKRDYPRGPEGGGDPFDPLSASLSSASSIT
jgi:hypothetical protein